MLDTVILRLPHSQYKVLLPERWSLVSTKRNPNGILVCEIFANNRTPEEKRLKIYRPRLTRIAQRGRDEHMKIEFSVQVILFGHTLQEASEVDFDNVLNILLKSIREMGISTTEEFLRYAKVTNFQPAKNLPISGGYIVSGIIKDMTKIVLTEKMQMDVKDYKNGGHGIQFYAESNALTIYDKIKDLEKNQKDAYDHDQEFQQDALFDFMQQKRKPEVARVEARLCQKVKINSVMSNLGFPTNPTFSDIFKDEVCKKILLDYFQRFIEPSFFVFTVDESPQRILQSLLQNSKRMSVDEAVKLVALKLLCKDECGVKGLRKIVETRASKRKWQRVAKQLKTLNQKIALKSCYGYISEIKKTLQQFKPYRLEKAEKLYTSHVHNSPVS